jgi:sigma-B regulation protein RsbU (phosphoserine phosphatase)
MKPTESVGGDYYDIIRENDHFWVIIGDVSGHGVGAGLIMMMVQSIIQAKLRDNFTIRPSELVNYVNKAYKYNILRIDRSRFMSIAAFSFHQDGTLEFSGRHDDPIFYSSREKKIEFLQTGGKLLSTWDPVRSINDVIMTMEPGDIMLLYTDGITEALSDSGEMFGIEKLGALFEKYNTCSPEEITDHVLNELAGYIVNDDITIVIIKKK